MKKKAWKSRIKKACIEAGTYKRFFDYTIDTLAGMLEKRDEAAELLAEDDEEIVIEQTNKSGFTNRVKNPVFSAWDDLNKSVLIYWRDLGLTPAGLKKINEEVFAKVKEEKNGNSLVNLLRQKQAADKGDKNE